MKDYPEEPQGDDENDTEKHRGENHFHVVQQDRDEEEGIGEGISQVSEPPSLTKKIGIGFLVLVIGSLVFSTLHKTKKVKPEEGNDVAPATYRANDSYTSSPQTATNSTVTKTQQLQARASGDASVPQVDKIYRVQQNAPISMYSAKVSETQASPTFATATSSGQSFNASNTAGGNLPLSSGQVSKLRSLIGGDSNNANSQFQQTVSNTPVETVNATSIANADYTVTQGTLISGALETAINSSLPGMVSAVVSEDVYAMRGDRVLIPKGSKLIGQYNAGINMGQQRVMIVWSRVIRADGIDVMLGSPGTDALGQSGLGADHLDTHFWDRFGQASLLSIIGGGIANAGVNSDDNNNSSSQYRMMLSNNFQQVAGSALASTMNIKPTISVDQGAKINVFVNRDLSFYNALGNAS